MKFAVAVLFCSLATDLFAHTTETTTVLTTTQDKDTQLQTHLSQVPDVDAQNYYNKNVNQAFRLFRPDLQTDDEKLKVKYGVEFLPSLIAKQRLPTLNYEIVERTEPRNKRDAGAIRFDDSSPSGRYGGTGTQGHSQAQAQSITASLNFGPFGASITAANSASNAHANNGFNGFGSGGAIAHATGVGGSHAGAQSSANVIGLSPPSPPYGNYGGYPGPAHYPTNYPGGGHGHYGGGYYEQGQYGHGHNTYGGGHYSAGQYGHFEQYGGGHHYPATYPNHLYGGGLAGYNLDAFEGYGRSGKLSRKGLKEKLQ